MQGALHSPQITKATGGLEHMKIDPVLLTHQEQYKETVLWEP